MSKRRACCWLEWLSSECFNRSALVSATVIPAKAGIHNWLRHLGLLPCNSLRGPSFRLIEKKQNIKAYVAPADTTLRPLNASNSLASSFRHGCALNAPYASRLFRRSVSGRFFVILNTVVQWMLGGGSARLCFLSKPARWIVAAFAPRRTTQQPPDGQDAAFDRAVLRQRLNRVGRTRGRVPTRRPQMRRHDQLIPSYQTNQRATRQQRNQADNTIHLPRTTHPIPCSHLS